ncbi:MAG TPA: Do family serine endopeptidase [Lacunisphaera sp.]|nr:Do family serine endopeptidase [Lacunisphaera sp.]
MKSKTAALSIILASSLVGLSLGLIAADKKPATATAPLKKPTLKVDATPINDTKSAVVTSYADALEAIRPAVISVYSSKVVREQIPEFYRQLGVQGREQKLRGLGSGVIISPDGYIITNNHVVEEADELKVSLSDDREYTAKLIGTDPKTDVAVIKIEAENLPTVTIADSSKLRVGDVVFAIGNPLGVGQTVTMGIVSATGRKVGILDEVQGYEDFIQTDAAINQGNSGGALIDARGRLVGINSAILSNSQGNIGIGFAIPVNLASSIMHSLIETGTVARGLLGVATAPITTELAEEFGLPKDTRGAIVTNLNPPDGPAAKAGIKRGDVIVGIDDRKVTSVDELRLYVGQSAPETKVTVKYLRDGKAEAKEIVLGRVSDGPSGELLPGVTAEMLTDDGRKQFRIDDRVENGLLITDVTENSPYAEYFRQGAVIEQINRIPITDLASAKKAMRNGRNIALIYFRGVYRYAIFYVR